MCAAARAGDPEADPAPMETTMKKAFVIPAVLAALAVAAAPAAAKSVAYKGKTKAGDTITFTRDGPKIKNIQSMVPTICVTSSGGTGGSSAGGDLYKPPGAYALGQTVKRKALQRTPFYPDEVTKSYTVATKGAGNGKVTGKLDENFSYSILGIDPFSGNSYIRIFLCRGVTTFTAMAK
jgi:hypothetical protein